jgi:hypothetical protein
MSLRTWIKEASGLFSHPHSASPFRGTHRRRFRKYRSLRELRSATALVRTHTEGLEIRTLPATLTWTGDVGQNWADNVDGNTNWSNDALPASGDVLVFPETTGDKSLFNDTTAGNSY